MAAHHRARVFLFATGAGGLPSREITFAEVAKRHGYSTALVGESGMFSSRYRASSCCDSTTVRLYYCKLRRIHPVQSGMFSSRHRASSCCDSTTVRLYYCKSVSLECLVAGIGLPRAVTAQPYACIIVSYGASVPSSL